MDERGPVPARFNSRPRSTLACGRVPSHAARPSWTTAHWSTSHSITTGRCCRSVEGSLPSLLTPWSTPSSTPSREW